MWFDASMVDYEEAIKLGITDAQYEPCIIKDVEHNNDICDEIIAAIRRSRFIVADSTAGSCAKCDTCDERPACRTRVKTRGGVYFEAGFAMGLGIPVIWSVHQDQVEQIHFDTRQYKHIMYAAPDELREKLRHRIEATIH